LTPSTISRELHRNAATRGGKLDYRASVAQWKAELLARRPKPAKLVTNDRLRAYVQERLSGQVRRLDGTPVGGTHAGGVEGPQQAAAAGPASRCDTISPVTTTPTWSTHQRARPNNPYTFEWCPDPGHARTGEHPGDRAPLRHRDHPGDKGGERAKRRRGETLATFSDATS
jgi:hypothetical protein